MATPVVQTRSTGATTAVDTATHAITMPASIAAGDLLIVVFSSDEAPTCTASSGWFKLGQASNSTVVTGAVFYKIAVGSDTCTVTTSTNQQSSHVAFRISGAGFPTGTSSNGSSTNSNPGSHAPGYTDDFLWIATRSGDSTVVATVAPTNYSNLQTQAAAGTGGASTNTAERALNASSEDPGTFTSNTEQWACWTLAVPPNLALTETLTDNYNDNSTDTAKWNDTVDTTQTVAEASQELEITTALTAGAGNRQSDNSYSLIGSYVSQKLVDAGTNGNPLFVIPNYSYQTGDEGRAVYFVIGDGNSYTAVYRDSGFSETSVGSASYVAATHVYFRVREASGTIFWDYSTDGLSWTNVGSELSSVVNVNISRLTIGTQAGYYDTALATNTLKFDDFNILPAPPTTSTSSSTSTSTSTTTSQSTSTSTTTSQSTSTSVSTSTSSTSSSTSISTSTTVSTSTSTSTSSTSTSTSVSTSTSQSTSTSTSTSTSSTSSSTSTTVSTSTSSSTSTSTSTSVSTSSTSTSISSSTSVSSTSSSTSQSTSTSTSVSTSSTSTSSTSTSTTTLPVLTNFRVTPHMTIRPAPPGVTMKGRLTR